MVLTTVAAFALGYLTPTPEDDWDDDDWDDDHADVAGDDIDLRTDDAGTAEDHEPPHAQVGR